ncbi:hypothetical protein Ae168Ps1_1627c [Pseudonocardia sp. Ae168_Ps1]|nr:hypothetical protein Ae150APs1_1621c [Pseudonocardia sp. Ae150A_Ps1]OLL79221.1 hypothetical protein Ae168Ps1_1627c [Pseudonocardia sp. Ae168_Ps1]OLL86642.1 hypothetical protein Ae263Ps1_3697 [Pseudonocardia sp. Ae263_Ps1]OLL93311.1 hypothetical protein Ae356Ps1_3208c [Pseudonocardia sp. Ae356_Ps1]
MAKPETAASRWAPTVGGVALGAALGLSLMNAFVWASDQWLSWLLVVLLAVGTTAFGSISRSARR